MLNRVRTIVTVTVMAMLVLLTAMFTTVYADVGTITDGEDISYDKNGGVLASMGFDTSKMPDTYDPDATTNPYGSDVSMMNEVNELVLFDTFNSGSSSISNIYGHNNRLNGSFGDFLSSSGSKNMSFIQQGSCVSAVKCDITGDGRDSALAVVYTRYSGDNNCDDFTIYMRLYDPVSGTCSDAFTVGHFLQNPYKRLKFGYQIQSQIQITAGDYDKDSIDEIAVYSPAAGENERNTIQFYDLIDGKDCKDPFDKNAWQRSWNYMLPNTSENLIITQPGFYEDGFALNCYNNIDLASGDADNDGICDLIVSYGASDTDFWDKDRQPLDQIKRSIPSRSVLLYGRDDGQMLRDSQPISYGGQSLVRVSFAFGDIDADGNEDMFFAGQLQGEQGENISRTLGRYVYDEDAGEMSLESMQNLKVVDGTWGSTNSGETGSGDDKDVFYSSNGWDEHYYSAPLMKTNLAIGKIFGDDSNTKIYLDSVLYSYDNGNYQIEDELDDDSKNKDDNYKGSCVFAGEKAMQKSQGEGPSSYYEFGADCVNFTAAASDYIVVNRVAAQNYRGTTSILYLDSNNNLTRKDPINEYGEYTGKPFQSDSYTTSLVSAIVDTDKDGLITEYTGEHNIQYQDPAVLAVLASPPYFKDVVAYDENDLLVYLNTEYGTSSGSEHGHESSFDCTLGGFLNTKFGAAGAYGLLNIGAGWARSETWGWEKERTFEMSYATEGGENAVVMYSVPTENYVYKVHGVTVDDDGSYEQFTNTMVITKPHKPVTQTLTLEDYNEIQEIYPEKLPDVTKYLTSTPGDPSSYPTNEKDLSKEALSHIDYSTDHPIDIAEKWAGTAFGSGSITQSISYSNTTRDRYKNHMDGFYGSVEAGGGTENDFLIFYGMEGGVSFEFSRMGGNTYASLEGADCSGTIKNMPLAAKGYGYGFSWKLLKYNIKDKGVTFPVVSYVVNDITSPPDLPENIEQDFDKTTDSQIALTWTYNSGNPQAFDIYRYEDFPIGGGEKLIGTVDGSDYKVMKDEDGNTLKDKDGHVVRGYTFIDTDLTADTSYEYRLKVRTAKLPGESIFSPVIEARTDVGTKPDLSLSADELTIYPDNTFNIRVNLADPENYQKDMSYQWQKYDSKKRKWNDLEGCDKQILHFYNCTEKDTGTYRCRVNLVRKQESSPQYISAFTESCKVGYSLRTVRFGGIEVFDGQGDSQTNTGISVKLSNTSESSKEKPTGVVTFSITGPNGTFDVAARVNEDTGEASISSVEDRIEDLGQQSFVDGGYVITASYGGSGIFYPAKDPEEYHYLRNIDESIFLSLKSSYYFGEDVAESAGLYDYKAGAGGKVTRTDLTDKITMLRFYQLDEDGISKTGDAVAEYDLSGNTAAVVPLNKKLSGKAYVEAYMAGSDTPAAARVIKTRRIPIQLSVMDKTTGTGESCSFLTSEDVELSIDTDPEEKNIETDNGKKSLSDFMLFSYYEQNGDFICDSDHTADNADEFIPASYNARVKLREAENGDDAYWFYVPTYKAGRFMVVGNYYLLSAGPVDKSTGSVSMISPDKKTDFTDEGYVGGTKIVLKAEPNNGYEISRWIIDDCGTKSYVTGTDKLTYTIRSQSTDGNGRIVISAEMKPKDSRIKIDKQGSGRIEVTPEIESGEIVLAGTKLKFTAVPDPGWHFVQWRLITLGGNNVVSAGTANEDGSNTKEITMPDSSAEVYAMFARDTVDVSAADNLEVLYKNNGGDPFHDTGELVMTEKGRNVPNGCEVTVRTGPGVELASDAEWVVSVTDETGDVPVSVTETTSQGRRACTFTLPEDALSCSVSVKTEKGKYTVTADTEGVLFTIDVDGKEMSGNTVHGILSGSQVDIRAITTDRGQHITGWIINGETKKTTDTLYSCNISDNLSIAVTTEPVEMHSVKVSAEGGGILKCIIKDAQGEELKTEYVGQDDPDHDIPVYHGESVSFTSSEENEEYTVTSISLNGVKQDLSEGTFTLSPVEADAAVTAMFGSNKYCSVTFSRNIRSEGAMLLDQNDNEIADGDTLTVPKNKDLIFSLIVPENSTGYYVDVNGKTLEAYETEIYGVGHVRYRYKAEKVTTDLNINVSDHEIIYIEDKSQLQYYMSTLADVAASDNPYAQPDGILTADIDMSGEGFDTVSDMYAIFDGGGYTISNLKLTVSSEPSAFFGVLHEGAELKNIVFEHADVNSEVISINGCGLLTHVNNGKISGVTIRDALFDVSSRAAGLAYTNNGIIEHCMVSGLTFKQGHGVDYVCAAGVSTSGANASVTGNYFEYICSKNPDTSDPVMLEKSIVAYDNGDAKKGAFTSNFFRQNYAAQAQDSHGISVYDGMTEQEAADAEADKAEFSRRIAYTMNKKLGEKIWGVSANDVNDSGIYLLTEKNGKHTAPVKAEFQYGKTITRYVAAGEIVLPGEELFGNNTPLAWLVGDNAYQPGMKIMISDDIIITGADTSEYEACLQRSSADGTESFVYYKSANDAVREAAKNDGQDPQIIIILGDAVLTGDTMTVDENTQLIVRDGATLTISKGLQLNVKGMLVAGPSADSKATVHKYGSLRNEGTVSISEKSQLINYGSAFENVNGGSVDGKERIICKPHRLGAWICADEPDEHGSWSKTSTCQVCGTTEELTTAPNPSPAEVTDISIRTEPTKVSYQTGETFTDEGLSVMAELSNGDKAAITDYKLYCDDQDITNDSVLEKEGDYEVTVSYEGAFYCTFMIHVSNASVTEPTGDKTDTDANTNTDTNSDGNSGGNNDGSAGSNTGSNTDGSVDGNSGGNNDNSTGGNTGSTNTNIINGTGTDTATSAPVSIQDAEIILSASKFTFNRYVQKPYVLTIGDMTLIAGKDYKVKWSAKKSKAPGTYSVTVTGKGHYTGTAKATYKIVKAANPLKVKARTATVKYSKLKKKAQTLKITRLIKFTKKGKGKVTYKLSSVKKGSRSYKKYFKINKKTGKVTIKKNRKMKKGIYKVRVKVKASGNNLYKASSWKTVTIRIKVK